MTRQVARWFLLSTVALAHVAGGCGRADRSTGSQTNWLTYCEQDSDCAVGECWCHACSTPCAAAGECTKSSCRGTTDLGCAEASTSPLLCVVECSTVADCRGRGPGIECVRGACLPASGAAGAGTGGRGAEGGTSSGGASGSPSGGAGGSAKPGASGAGGTNGGGGGSSGTGSALAGEAGQAGAPPEGVLGPTEARIAIYRDGACVVSAGKVFCWGLNQYGQVGVTPDALAQFGPIGIVEVPRLPQVAGVAISGNHACALTEGGEVYCWGNNDSLQVGSESAPALTCAAETVSDLPCQPTPTRVPDVDHVVELSVDAGVSCAVIADGSVHCWGATSELEPWLSTLASVKSFSVGSPVSTGPLVACATLADDAVTCNFELPAEVAAWGNARTLKLRNGSLLSEVTGFGCALRTDGGVSCFGDDGFGQLGDGAAPGSRAFAGGVTDLSVGAAHACALLADGKLECWGSNDYGAVGGYPLESPNCGRSTCEAAPRVVDGIPPLVAIGASDDVTCGFAADETLWCWGYGASTFGAPVRVVGPWEANGAACNEILEHVVSSRYFGNTQCTTDADCVVIPLDLPCDHTCDAAPVEKQYAADFEAALAGLRDDVCASATAAGCASPAPTCPEKSLRVVCNTGNCTLDDPVRTGCTDQCACAIERRMASPNIVCDGFNLWIQDAETCGKCVGSFVYLVVANRGGTAFDGDAVLSFYQRPDGAPVVPADRTVSLQLGPGEVSDPIRIDSISKGYLDISINGTGDCELDDNGLTWDFPSPSNACP